MKEINFKDKGEVFVCLLESFSCDSTPALPSIIKEGSIYSEERMIHDYFSGRKWTDLAQEFVLKRDSYVMELATYHLDREVFRYYIPFYIYASLLNDGGWVYESCFLSQYLCPKCQDQDDFLDYILSFKDVQLKILSQYVYYEMNLYNDFEVKDAFDDFWSMFRD